MIEIPFHALSAAALRGVIEEFVTRDGTDYGEMECTVQQKVAQVERQLKLGEVVIVFDERSETNHIISAHDWDEVLARGGEISSNG